MAAYFIFIRKETKDSAELQTFAQKAGPTINGRNATVLTHYARHVVLEGEEVEGIALLSFPTRDEALAWYKSPEYGAARQHRLKGAEYRGLLVDGI